MATWPDLLPGVLLQGNTGQRSETVIRSNMDNGRPKLRRRFNDATTHRRGRFLFNDLQMQVFEGWWVHYADYGAAWCEIPICDAQGVSRQTARFVGEYSARRVAANVWDVDLTLELQKQRVLSQQELDNIINPLTQPDFDATDWDATDWSTTA